MYPTRVPAARVPDTFRVDQRLQRRYPIPFDLEYKLLTKGRVGHSGFGKVLNISSRGVFFDTDDLLPVGDPIELRISWPFLLDGICQLILILRGRIIRSDGNGIAIMTVTFEFRTTAARMIGA